MENSNKFHTKVWNDDTWYNKSRHHKYFSIKEIITEKMFVIFFKRDIVLKTVL